MNVDLAAVVAALFAMLARMVMVRQRAEGAARKDAEIQQQKAKINDLQRAAAIRDRLRRVRVGRVPTDHITYRD